ncbi:hypothetical protein EI94DRAFT_1814686 [Lactarius quietus]|nr:hypothetical protein EI94DRAFT_1814686 [Lactarius quietus]
MSYPPSTEERTLDDIIKEVERFRILVIGRAGVGKSSLINRVFGLKRKQELAPVEDNQAGYAEIEREFVSNDNELFVLHDSKGFEPGDLENFKTVSNFIKDRLQKPLLKDRIHGIWLCVDTPTAGGRVFETGDEKLLEFVHEKGVPLVLVFTQYDRLERTKAFQLRGNKEIKETDRADRSKEDANKAFETCLESLNLKSGTPIPTYAKVSVRKGYEELISSLVETTGRVAKKQVKGDAWVLWSMAQRASLPVKIETCIKKGISYYTLAVASSLPFVGQWILRDCLRKVHNDIITCWNFKDGEPGVLKRLEFHEEMFRLVDEVQTAPSLRAKPSNVDDAIKYATLAALASASLGAVVAAGSVAALSAGWLTMAIQQNFSEARRMLVAYIVDLVKVLMELFHTTLTLDLALTTSPKELNQAFKAYKGSPSCQSIHESIRSKKRWIGDDVGGEISHLLEVDKCYI